MKLTTCFEKAHLFRYFQNFSLNKIYDIRYTQKRKNSSTLIVDIFMRSTEETSYFDTFYVDSKEIGGEVYINKGNNQHVTVDSQYVA